LLKLRSLASRSRRRISSWSTVLFNRSSQHDDRDDSRKQGRSARQAAEALFAPKPQRIEPTIREAAQTDEVVRRPRVLAVAAAAPPIEHSEPKEPPCQRRLNPDPLGSISPIES
jgi:urease accessory protein UreF